MSRVLTESVELGANGLPDLPPVPGVRLVVESWGAGAEIRGNREGLRLLARALIGVARMPEVPGYHVHLDDLHGLEGEVVVALDPG